MVSVIRAGFAALLRVGGGGGGGGDKFLAAGFCRVTVVRLGAFGSAAPSIGAFFMGTVGIGALDFGALTGGAVTVGRGGGARRANLAGACLAGAVRAGTPGGAGGAGGRARRSPLTFGNAAAGFRVAGNLVTRRALISTGGVGNGATTGDAFVALSRTDTGARLDADTTGRASAWRCRTGAIRGTGGVRCKFGICSLDITGRLGELGCTNRIGAIGVAAGLSYMALRLIVTPEDPCPPINTVDWAKANWLPKAAINPAKNGNGRQDIRA